jgi:hypothetical protein
MRAEQKMIEQTLEVIQPPTPELKSDFRGVNIS